MPIPSFTIDGVLPPYVGADGPGGAPEDMTPYVVGATEVVATLGTTNERKTILRGWLRHRQDLRGIGFDRGFQWLDGSFVEQKEPKDLDIVTFIYRPIFAQAPAQVSALMGANMASFDRASLRAQLKLDAFFIDLQGSLEFSLNFSRYLLGLFSHQRGTDLWKGMLQVRLENAADDGVALGMLGPEPVAPAPAAVGGVTP